MSFSERLHEIRIEKGISQDKLADMIGVSQTSIYQWEKGTRKPKSEQIIKLAKALDVSTSYLATDILTNSLMNAVEALAKEYGIDLDSSDGQNDEVHEITEEYIVFELQKLNLNGQIRLLEHIEDLSKIPEYRRETDEKQHQSKI